MKRAAWNHPKIKLLCRDLNLPLCYVNGILESIWIVTSAKLPAGDIGRWTNEEIAAAIEYPGDADALISALIRRRFLDEIPEELGRLYVHDWHDHLDQQTKRTLSRWDRTYGNGMPVSWKQPGRPKHDEKLVETSNKLATTSLPVPVPVPVPLRKPSRDLTDSKVFKNRRRHAEVSRKNGNGNGKHATIWPQAAAAVQKHFPGTEDSWIEELAARCQRILPAMGREITELTDKVLADAISQSHKQTQHSAALYLTTVPTTIQNWAKR